MKWLSERVKWNYGSKWTEWMTRYSNVVWAMKACCCNSPASTIWSSTHMSYPLPQAIKNSSFCGRSSEKFAVEVAMLMQGENCYKLLKACVCVGVSLGRGRWRGLMHFFLWWIAITCDAVLQFLIMCREGKLWCLYCKICNKRMQTMQFPDEYWPFMCSVI